MTTKRHGVLLNATSQPVWRLGIWQIFDPWVDPHLQMLQGNIVPKRTRPLTIEFHCRRVVQRLVRSLARLDQQVREWDCFLEEGGLTGAHPELVFDIPEEGGIAADSVFYYLNLFIDDLARVVPHVLAYERGDQKAIEKLVSEYGQDPEAIMGGDVASRLVKVIRRIAQLRRRMSEIQQQMDAMQQTEIFHLKQTIEETEAMGGDPLGDLVKQLMQELSERKIQLEVARQQ